MPRPVVGLTCYLEPARWGAWDLPAALVPQWYVDLFHEGGRRRRRAAAARTSARRLDRLDGLALVGGADLDATRYGAAAA